MLKMSPESSSSTPVDADCQMRVSSWEFGGPDFSQRVRRLTQDGLSCVWEVYSTEVNDQYGGMYWSGVVVWAGWWKVINDSICLVAKGTIEFDKVTSSSYKWSWENMLNVHLSVFYFSLFCCFWEISPWLLRFCTASFVSLAQRV